MTQKENDIVLYRLLDHLRKTNFSGYDPYDGLMGILKPQCFAKYWMQFMKRFPLNLRPFMGIKKARNPKAIGLFLDGLSKMYISNHDPFVLTDMHSLFEWLRNNKSRGFSGPCWGYPFDWYSGDLLISAHTPSIVATAYVTKGIYHYYNITQNPDALDILKSIKHFLLKDIPVYKDDSGLCFSYTPLRRDCIYNASLLAAETLTYVGILTDDYMSLNKAEQAINFVLDKQCSDGHWNYSLDINSGIEREQIDFHQGFILESLLSIQSYHSNCIDFSTAIHKGYQYYTHQQFFTNGRSKWRLPKKWPIDIHHQAQGIITHALSSPCIPDALKFANRIADWTLRHLYNENGYFYYQKWPLMTNRISYIRWAQAWMLKALSYLKHESLKVPDKRRSVCNEDHLFTKSSQ